MTSLLHDLLVDLKRRTDYVLGQLSAHAHGLLPEFKQHHATITRRVERTRTAIENLLADPDLGNSLLEPNFFIDFKRLSERILSVEDSTLLILSRCSKDDQLLSSLLQRICLEVRYSDAPPLCAALSFQYFQALVGMDIIMTPQTQAYEFLAVPDLYHELAHFVVFRRRDPFVVGSLRLIHDYFSNAERRAQQRGSPQASVEAIKANHDLWAGDYWQVEFMCDMIATFWCGPAYGWANLRLSATRGDPYQEGSKHPADDARRIGIACMLNLMGEGAAARDIDAKWDELKRLTSSAIPSGYNRRYPEVLLEKLAAVVHQTCIDSGFQDFADQAKQFGRASVSGIVNMAWNSFTTDAARFLQLEKSALQDLHRLVGH